MCWLSKDNPVKERAKEDIPVFKIVINFNGIRSFYFNFNYKLGETYFRKLGDVIPDDINDDIVYQIREGFHSYSNECKINMNDYNMITICKIFSKENSILDRIVSSYLLSKAECIIPKDSLYYLNKDGEYVSDQIKIISIEDVLMH